MEEDSLEQNASLAIANELMDNYENQITELNTQLERLYNDLKDAGAPVILEMVD